MLTVATLLWDANAHSRDFSKIYDESWVEKLYDGFARNLTRPLTFALFTDRPRRFPGRPIEQHKIATPVPHYGCCIEPFRLNRPTIIVGLDTVVTGNCDALADYCLTQTLVALPRDPFMPQRACNGVALVPAGNRAIFDSWRGENDMEWLRRFPHAPIDDLFPGQVVSYKGTVKYAGLHDARIVYFHGMEKPHELAGLEWIERHWNGRAQAAA